MNDAVIAGRYANALLRFAREKGAEKPLFEEVYALLHNPAGLSSAPHSPELEAFVTLLARKGREEYLSQALRRFIDLYCRETGTAIARLSTAGEAPELSERLRGIITARTGGEIIMETNVDPSIGGGFVLDVEGIRLDASLRRQIEIVRRTLAVSNKKMV